MKTMKVKFRVSPSAGLALAELFFSVWGILIDLTHSEWAAWSIPGTVLRKSCYRDTETQFI